MAVELLADPEDHIGHVCWTGPYSPDGPDGLQSLINDVVATLNTLSWLLVVAEPGAIDFYPKYRWDRHFRHELGIGSIRSSSARPSTLLSCAERFFTILKSYMRFREEFVAMDRAAAQLYFDRKAVAVVSPQERRMVFHSALGGSSSVSFRCQTLSSFPVKMGSEVRLAGLPLQVAGFEIGKMGEAIVHAQVMAFAPMRRGRK